METFHHHDRELEELRAEIQVLRVELKLAHHENARLITIINKLLPQDVKKLSFIKISIGGTMPVGPVTMNVGDKKVATVLGFDQNGAAMAIDFTANPVTWVDDNPSVVSDAQSPDHDNLTAVAAGVANITATCAGFSDTEAATVLAQAPVFSSIKVSID